MFLVFDWWLNVSWLKSHRNATYCIGFNIVIHIFNTSVSAKMVQGQRKWRAVIYIISGDLMYWLTDQNLRCTFAKEIIETYVRPPPCRCFRLVNDSYKHEACHYRWQCTKVSSIFIWSCKAPFTYLISYLWGYDFSYIKLISPQCRIYASVNRVSIGSDKSVSPIRHEPII